MPLDNDLVEVTRLLGVQSPESKIINDQHLRSQQAAYYFLGAVVGPGLMDKLEHLVCPQEQYVVARTTGAVPQGRSQERLADTGRAEEDHVLMPLDKTQREQIPDPVSVERNRCIPVEAFEGLFLLEPGPLQPVHKHFVVPAVDLVLHDQLHELKLTQVGFPGIRHPVWQDRQHPRQAQPFQDRHQRLFDLRHFHLLLVAGGGQSCPHRARSAVVAE